MSGKEICWWLLFALNFLIYGGTCIMIIKRKLFTTISMRSPVLLLMTIVGNFFINQIIILFQLFSINTISAFYYFFRVMVTVSLILRYERILKCYNIYKNNEKEDEQLFSKKRYLYQEKYYFKILALCLILIAIPMIILYFVDKENVEVFFRFNLIYDFTNLIPTSINIRYEMNLIIWICWNFLEQAILIFYIYRTLSKCILEKLKFELIFSFVVWFIYAFICSAFNLYEKDNSLIKESYTNLFLIILSLIVNYCLLFVNGILPIIISYNFRTSISYHFNPKLLGNLFLFLTNEQCYNTFYDYLKKNNIKNGIFYLQLYTHIMKYKLNFAMSVGNQTEALNDLNDIYNKYFLNDNYIGNLLDTTIVLKIRKEYEGLENRILPEIFDQALQNVFSELGKIFDEFHNKNEYSELYYKIKEYSYIHCKMCNTGLINQN